MIASLRAFDAVVVGAGPAGLSAAAELSRTGTCLLLDRGPEARARDRGAPADVLGGVGGAGLFSDGKHSFFPSATALWRLPDETTFGAAFERTAALFARHGVDAGALPAARNADAAAPGRWQEKLYPSVYVPFERRLAMIEELWSEAHDRAHDAEVIAAERAGASIALDVSRAGSREEVRAQRLVVATGRLSPRWTKSWLGPLGASFAFGRVEFGVRIEGPSTAPFFARLPGVDGKLRFVEPGGATEVRTFCTCRDGEVVLGDADGLRAVSGRADGPKTGRSNVGLVVRTADEALGRSVLAALETSRPAAFALGDWLDGGDARIASCFGERGAGVLRRAVERLLEWAPELARMHATVHLPCVEGVGDYPADDGALRVAPSVHVAGDVCGRFRGIVASLVSGRYAALRPS